MTLLFKHGYPDKSSPDYHSYKALITLGLKFIGDTLLLSGTVSAIVYIFVSCLILSFPNICNDHKIYVEEESI